MKTYTLTLGRGEGRKIDVEAYSTAFCAVDLLDAIAHAKKLVRARMVSEQEDTALIQEAENSLVWAPSVDFLRYS